MPVELKVPEVGESITEVFIGEWLKSEGDTVEKDEALVEVETDKATLEVPASVGGTLTKVLKQQGDTAEVGEVIAHISEEGAEAGEDAGSEDAQAAEAESEEDTETQEVEADSGEQTEASSQADEVADQDSEAGVSPEQDVEKGEPEKRGYEGDEETSASDSDGEPRIMPAAQRLLEENGVSADQVEATGPGGRLLKEDVQKYLKKQGSEQGDKQGSSQQKETQKSQQKEAPKQEREAPASSSSDREEEAVPMSPLRRRIAERLVEAQQNAALLTTFNEIDMSEVMALRNEYKEAFTERYEGVRLGFMSFFVKAVIDALKQFPQLNAEIQGTDIIYKNYYDIGVAVSSKKGLLVPIIRNAERLSFAEIEQTVSDFGKRAQNNKISPEELQGGTFTISNGGVFGSLMSTPIVNPPQSGVLGMHSIQQRPVAEDGQVVIKPMMYIALTYDHRIVDGREAVTFLRRVKEAVERPARMLLEV